MHDQAMPARVTRRARILAYLETRPGRTAYEIGVALDARRPNGTVAGSVFQLLRDMERKAQVVATKQFRPQQGRWVNLWHLAPAGATPLPVSPPPLGDAERYRARNRVNQRRSRARRRDPAVLAPRGAWRAGQRALALTLICSSPCLGSLRLRPWRFVRPAACGPRAWHGLAPTVSGTACGAVSTSAPRPGRPGRHERQRRVHAASLAAVRARGALHREYSGGPAGPTADRSRGGPRRPAHPGAARTGRVLGAGADPARRPDAGAAAEATRCRPPVRGLQGAHRLPRRRADRTRSISPGRMGAGQPG